MNRQLIAIFGAAALFGPIAQGHNHITVDTANGMQDDLALLRAGVFPGETETIRAADRQLMNGPLPKVYELEVPQTNGATQGWLTHDTDLLTFTSDWFYGSGRLGLGFSFFDFLYEQPGEFSIEIVGVEAVYGQDEARFVHRSPFDEAASDGASPSSRSLFLGVGRHDHGQRMLIEFDGLYDVTYRLRDGGGIFRTDASSDRKSDVIVRVSGPMALIADHNEDAEINAFDVEAVIEGVETGALSNDVDGSGEVDFFDVAELLRTIGSLR
ncbi:MAG: hypothetical protein AAGB34_01560 [Planctomycetota bacterium]